MLIGICVDRYLIIKVKLQGIYKTRISQYLNWCVALFKFFMLEKIKLTRTHCSETAMLNYINYITVDAGC